MWNDNNQYAAAAVSLAGHDVHQHAINDLSRLFSSSISRKWGYQESPSRHEVIGALGWGRRLLTAASNEDGREWMHVGVFTAE